MTAGKQRWTRYVPQNALPSAAALAFIVALAVFVVAVVAPPALQTTAINFLAMLTGVLALSVFTGNSGVLSFGHAAFMALGAQISATMTMSPLFKKQFLTLLPEVVQQSQWNFWCALLLAVVLVAVIAWTAGLAITKLTVTSMTIATLGFLIIVHSLMNAASGITRGNQAMMTIPRYSTLAAAGILAVLAVIVARVYRDSIAGLRLRASRDNEAAARSIGVDVEWQRMVAWVLSSALAAVAGAILAHHLTVFTPRTFYFDLSFSLIVMLVVGGMSSVTGGVVGAFFVTILLEIVRRYENGFSLGSLSVPPIFGLTQTVLCLVIIAVLYWRQSGFLGFDELEERVRLLRVANRLNGARSKSELPAVSKIPPCTLSVNGVTKAYGGLVAGDNITFKLNSGEILGLIGPNGSGKSTLLGCIAGTHAPTSGTVAIDDTVISGMPPHQIARLGLGRTFQTVRLFNELTVLDNVVTAASIALPRHGRPQLEGLAFDLLTELKIDGLAERKAGTLTYGQQRRTEIARALALEPRFLLLDEPAAGMNDNETADLLDILRALVGERGIGLLIVDHDMHLIMNLCHRLIVLNKGQLIAAGTPAEVRLNQEVLDAYLGTSASRLKDQNAPTDLHTNIGV